MIASANCAVFCGILLAGPIASGLTALGILPTQGIALVGAATILMGTWLRRAMKWEGKND